MARNDQDFNKRLQTAAAAKQDLLANARAIATGMADGAAVRQAEHLALVQARDLRRQARDDAKAVKAQKEAEERAAAAAEAQRAAEAELAAQEAERNRGARELAELRAKQKAGRDAKYAARQARRDSRKSG